MSEYFDNGGIVLRFKLILQYCKIDIYQGTKRNNSKTFCSENMIDNKMYVIGLLKFHVLLAPPPPPYWIFNAFKIMLSPLSILSCGILY